MEIGLVPVDIARCNGGGDEGGGLDERGRAWVRGGGISLYSGMVQLKSHATGVMSAGPILLKKAEKRVHFNPTDMTLKFLCHVIFSRDFRVISAGTKSSDACSVKFNFSITRK